MCAACHSGRASLQLLDHNAEPSYLAPVLPGSAQPVALFLFGSDLARVTTHVPFRISVCYSCRSCLLLFIACMACLLLCVFARLDMTDASET